MSTRSRFNPLVIVLIVMAFLIGAAVWWALRSSTETNSHVASEQVVEPATGAHADALSNVPRNAESSPSLDATRTVGSTTAANTPVARDETFSVTGRCVDAGGHALAGVHVEVLGLRWSADSGIKALDKTFDTASDATGKFEMHLEPSAHQDVTRILSVGIEGRLAGFSALLAEVKPAAPHRFEAGDIVLVRGVTLSGSVRDAVGEPEPDATVRAMRDGVPGSLQRHPDRAVTKADGNFDITDAAAGVLYVRAETTDGRESAQLELNLVPGETKSAVDLVLPQFDDPLAVTGVVVDASDRPLEKVKVAFTSRSPNGSSSHERVTDARGRFRIAGAAGATMRLRAVSSDTSLGATIVENITAGTHGMRIVLRAARLVTLRVRDGAGHPVERFGWTSSEVGTYRSTVIDTQPEALRAGGEAPMRADGDPLSIAVTASGYETTTVGPFALSAIGGSIDVRMSSMPAIHGVVLFEHDQPVPGATVSMLATFPRNEKHTQGAFDLTYLPCEGCPTAITDARGRFTLPAPKSGRFVVRAAPTDRPPAVSDEFTITPDGVDPDVRVDVHKGGAIEGSVQRTGSPPEPDWIVIASCGDGAPSRAKSDAQGHFRFNALAPGGWQLRVRRPQDDYDLTGVGSEQFAGRDAPTIQWDCVVSSGEVTHYDLILPASSVLVLELGPPFDAGKWGASVVLPCPALGSNREHGMKGDGSHRTLEFECTGQADVSVIGSRDGNSWNYAGPVKIESGRNYFRLALDTGDVVGHVTDATIGTTRVVLMWQRASDGWSTFSRTDVDKDGRFKIQHAPAGDCTLRVEGTKNVRERKVTVSNGALLDVGEL